MSWKRERNEVDEFFVCFSPKHFVSFCFYLDFYQIGYACGLCICNESYFRSLLSWCWRYRWLQWTLFVILTSHSDFLSRVTGTISSCDINQMMVSKLTYMIMPYGSRDCNATSFLRSSHNLVIPSNISDI